MCLKYTIIILGVAALTQCYRNDCSKMEYERCVRMADPLIKEPHLVFPDNMDDIDIVCRTWNKFVDCLKRYTDKCFTDQQRKQFNKAVENPIESVHQMCTQSRYQNEYLQHAPCIRSTITEKSHCGQHYSLLVDQVAQGEIISKTILCCSHDRFKNCVQQETRRLCDRGVTDGPAARFASQTIDKALSFLQDQCYNYIPNSGDCTTIPTDSLPFSDPLMISPSSSEVYPWSTVQDMAAPKEVLPDRVTPPKPTSMSWLPSSVSDSINQQTQGTMLGSRTRPASYGRSSSWMETSNQNTQPGMNTVQMGQDATPTQPSRPDWATISSWPQEDSTSNPPLSNVYTTLQMIVSKSTAFSQKQLNVTMAHPRPFNLVPATPTISDVPITNPQETIGANFKVGSNNEKIIEPTSTIFFYPDGDAELLDMTSKSTRDEMDNKMMTSSWEIENSGDNQPAGGDSTMMTSSETWYPAAGNQLVNEVDEPNQQGLTKPKNDAVTVEGKQLFSLTVIATVLTAFC